MEEDGREKGMEKGEKGKDGCGKEGRMGGERKKGEG